MLFSNCYLAGVAVAVILISLISVCRHDIVVFVARVVVVVWLGLWLWFSHWLSLLLLLLLLLLMVVLSISSFGLSRIRDPNHCTVRHNSWRKQRVYANVPVLFHVCFLFVSAPFGRKTKNVSTEIVFLSLIDLRVQPPTTQWAEILCNCHRTKKLISILSQNTILNSWNHIDLRLYFQKKTNLISFHSNAGMSYW